MNRLILLLLSFFIITNSVNAKTPSWWSSIKESSRDKRLELNFSSNDLTNSTNNVMEFQFNSLEHISLLNSLTRKLNIGKPLSTKTVKQIHQFVNSYHLDFQNLIKSSEIVEMSKLLSQRNQIIFDNSKKTHIQDTNDALYVLKNGEDEDSEINDIIHINILDKTGKMIVRKLISFIYINLSLLDYYNQFISKLAKNKTFNFISNYDNPDELYKLTDIVDYHHNQNLTYKLIEAVKLLDMITSSEHKESLTSEELNLAEKLKNFDSYRLIEDLSTLDLFSMGIEQFYAFIKDSYTITIRTGGYAGSRLFGAVTGAIQLRSGKLKNLPKSEMDQIKDKLKPLDILFDKAPFRLTDKLIPGYFGHVGIWLGTETELKELELWDTPEIRPYQKEIRAGRNVLEALRPGIDVHTLESFFDIDDFAVVRAFKYNENEKAQYVLNAFAQIGKDYDFNFDVETTKRIVCSELIYAVFEDKEWNTKPVVGRFTITPDDVARTLFNNKNRDTSKVVLFFQDGRLVTEENKKNQSLFERVTKEK